MINKKYNINKFINYCIIALAFVLPISKAGIVFFEILIFLLWIIEGNFSKKFKQLKNSKIIMTLFFLILLSIISVLWSSDKAFAIVYIKKYWHFLVIPAIYTSFDRQNLPKVFSAFLMAMFISEIMSYGIFFEVIHYKNIPSSDPAPFMNHTEYSMFLSFTSMILLNRIFLEKSKKLKIFYLIYFLFVVTNLFLNGGRTGQIIFIFSIFVMGFLNIRNKVKSLFIMLTLSLSIFFIAYYNSPNFYKRYDSASKAVVKMFKYKDFSLDFAARPSLWISGSLVFRDNFLYGTGIGNEVKGMRKYAEKYNLTWYLNVPLKGYIDYHNQYIQYGVQLGVVGFLLFLYLIYLLFYEVPKERMYKNIAIVFAISIALYSMSGPTLHLMVPMTFFAFFVSVLYNKSVSEVN